MEDTETGVASHEMEITELSLKFNISSAYTSFVAIERRDGTTSKVSQPNIDALAEVRCPITHRAKRWTYFHTNPSRTYRAPKGSN